MKMGLEDWLEAVETKRIPVIEALYEWTTWAAHQEVMDLRRYSEVVREWLPLAEWPPGDGKFLVIKTNPMYWKGPSDFYEFVDGCFGEMFQLGAFLKSYVGEETRSKREQMVDRAIEAKQLREQGLTQQQAAEVLGVSQQTVGRDLSKNSVITPEMDKPKRQVIGYRITEYTQPKTAAAKIREKFGDEFAKALCEELGQAFSSGGVI